jgi:hypothetical protein
LPFTCAASTLADSIQPSCAPAGNIIPSSSRRTTRSVGSRADGLIDTRKRVRPFGGALSVGAGRLACCTSGGGVVFAFAAPTDSRGGGNDEPGRGSGGGLLARIPLGGVLEPFGGEVVGPFGAGELEPFGAGVLGLAGGAAVNDSSKSALARASALIRRGSPASSAASAARLTQRIASSRLPVRQS